MVVAKDSYSPDSNGIILSPITNSIINLDQGDPVVFEPYWKKRSDEYATVIKGNDLMSYMSNPSDVCWFMLPETKDAIKRIHSVVGNAEIEDKHIVVGTGSSQLFLAALFALCPSDSPQPINVVAQAPYYSEYQDQIRFLSSRLFQWDGDAALYDKNEPYIELVCSPNNPDGVIQEPVVKSEAKGKLIHDLAYYWPQYTPITHKADHDIMLFTFSKSTGHAGSRIGWALVKDVEVATKMTRFLQLSSIGVAKDSQTRFVKIIGALCDSYNNFGSAESELFFQYGKRRMRERWEKLRAAIEQSKIFTAANYPKAFCNFTNESSETYPGFAWLKGEEGIEDAKSYLRKLNILVREGNRFGAGQNHVRVTMLGPDDVFNELLARLSNAKRDVV
ncbi:hypothetical protein TanjilG_20724 [Lupinus angustifolius]|uniref:Alliinase C-terminal domain-containing protein n=1 Tax=Lupinus angustifolius TaxID=3871 RepID=A0A4P1QRL4_LUPAN|nr:PREDICTED: tryptophan aminotransferase-related protein 1 [Lupinus angustifolius]OIV93062.1 hypothetical protein TanjilG_20724 [Lupinus angustifolius]